MKNKAHGFALTYLSLLFLFSVWILLDGFVIERRFAAVAEQSAPETQLSADEITVTDSGYTASGVRVTLSETRWGDTTVHMAEVEIADSQLLKTALAENTFGRNITETTAEMAEAHGAILAVNGDYYGSRRKGYVVRNGVLYRSTVSSRDQEDLCVWPDGNMTVILEGETSAEELMEAGVTQVLSFGPALVVDGEIAVSAEDEVGRAMASNPRTAVAMYSPLHYLFVVSDGRTDADEGLTLLELAEFLKAQGVQLAYNLDGGGSSTMVFMDEVVNWPTTNGRRSERAVSDIVYISGAE